MTLIHLRMTCFFFIVAAFYISPLFAQHEPAEKPFPALIDAVIDEKLDELDRLWAEAQRLDQAGLLEEAIAVANRLRKLDAELSGPNAKLGVELIKWIADRRETLNHFDQAIRARKKFLELKTRQLGRNDWRVVDASNELKRTERLASLDDKELARYRSVAELDIVVSESLQSGEYGKAIAPAAHRCEILRSILGELDTVYLSQLSEIGAIHRLTGNHGQAEEILLQAVELTRKAYGTNHPQYAESLNQLAIVYQESGRFTDSISLLKEAVVITGRTRGKHTLWYASVINNLAMLYYRMGDYEMAEPLLVECVALERKLRTESDPHLATPLHNLGVLYYKLEQFDQALPLLKESVEIRHRLLGETHPLYFESVVTFGEYMRNSGEIDRGIALLEEIRAPMEKQLGKQHPMVATLCNNLALLYWKKNDLPAAQRLLAESMQIREGILSDLHPERIETISSLAALVHASADYERSAQLHVKALRSARSQLELTSLVQSERQQLMTAMTVRHQLDNFLSLAVDPKATDLKIDAQSYAEVLAWKGMTLVRQMQIRRVAQDEAIAPTLLALQQAASKLATASRLAPNPDDRDQWHQRLNRLTAEKERLEQELSHESVTFRNAIKPTTVAMVRDAIPENAVLVDFIEFRRLSPRDPAKSNTPIPFVDSLLVFVVSREDAPVLVNLGPIRGLTEDIDLWRQSSGRTEQSRAAAIRLRKRLFDPIEKIIAGFELLLVSSDGEIGRLPLAALPGSKPATYLLEDFQIAMIPVARMLPDLVGRQSQRELSGGLLVMGDVDYDQDEMPTAKVTRKSWKRSDTSQVRGGIQFARLDATAGEMATIQKLFVDLFQPEADQVKTLESSMATEAVFRDIAANYYNIHLATHGFFAAPQHTSATTRAAFGNDEDQIPSTSQSNLRGFNPGLLSGLAFSGANRKPEADQDDGILTADEISTLSLDGVDLVVLSACETGLGKVAGGEGLIGIQRAFQVAGARTTIASLWKVDDNVTRQLMERFYRNYWKKEMSKIDALREAQLYLLNNPDAIRGDARRKPENEDNEPKRLSPEFWAAFSLSGDWREQSTAAQFSGRAFSV